MPNSPNIVLIVMDTARSDFVDTAVNGREVTPFLSGLAERGGKFSEAYSASPWTLPSHASLFTGTYPSKHGAHAESKHLRDDIQTLAGTLSENGYETFGISNNIWVSDNFGFEAGFDTFVRNWQLLQFDNDVGGVGLTNQGRDKWFAVARTLIQGNPVANAVNAAYTKFRYSNYSPDDGAGRTNKRAEGLLSDHDGDDPFFLFINYLEPHLEYRPPKRFAERFLPEGVSYREANEVEQNAWKYVTEQAEISDSEFEILRALYAAETAYLDQRIGELAETIRERDEETVFVVVGDHGENLGDHGLMDHQYCLYDTLLHVPFVVGGGPFTDHGTDDRLVQLPDVAPTLLDVAGVEAPSFRSQSQGQSVLSPEFDRDTVIAEYLSPMPSRDAIEKRVGDPHDVIDSYLRSLRCIRRDGYKLVVGSDGEKELYDVESDPREQTDLSSERPKEVTRLETELDEWLDSFEQPDGVDTGEINDGVKDTLEQLGYIQ
ncbi:sulfatase [Halopelagius longus]|uniref:Sulfatase n=1 Tax=Halopelagius longus TaxID=1236180 RepID=A0A1H1GJN5_9EURY|nr:sulfatase [Halopelagius longus]RDI69698.1 sulfatase [Halopelagius longus]SDR13452.1 Arylsulfatase A [Halopelagius longus]